MSNNNKRKIIFIFIIVLLSSILISCTLSPQVAYDNFVTDLDVLYRFEEIAFNVEFGRYSNTFQADIRYLILDLNTLNIDHPEVKRINRAFINSANNFLRASEYYLNDQNDQGSYYLEEAEDGYNDALQDYYDFITRGN